MVTMSFSYNVRPYKTNDFAQNRFFVGNNCSVANGSQLVRIVKKIFFDKISRLGIRDNFSGKKKKKVRIKITNDVRVGCELLM